MSLVFTFAESHLCYWMYFRYIKMCLKWHPFRCPLKNKVSELKLSQNWSHLLCNPLIFTWIVNISSKNKCSEWVHTMHRDNSVCCIIYSGYCVGPGFHVWKVYPDGTVLCLSCFIILSIVIPLFIQSCISRRTDAGTGETWYLLTSEPSIITKWVVHICMLVKWALIGVHYMCFSHLGVSIDSRVLCLSRLYLFWTSARIFSTDRGQVYPLVLR